MPSIVFYSPHLESEWKDEVILTQKGEEKKFIFIITENAPKTLDFKVVLRGEKNRAEIAVLVCGRKNLSTTANITLVHDAPETYGRIIARAALFDESQLVFKGMLEVTGRGLQSDTYFSGKALLLSDKARAEVYPYLEIKTDEVRASHGVSVGKVDDQLLFYLTQRGLSREEAEKIYLSGFFREVVQELPRTYYDTFFQQI